LGQIAAETGRELTEEERREVRTALEELGEQLRVVAIEAGAEARRLAAEKRRRPRSGRA
jgi:hypothetical protein